MVGAGGRSAGAVAGRPWYAGVMGIEDRDYFQEDRARRAGLSGPGPKPRRDGPPVRLPASAYRRQPPGSSIGAWLAWIVIGVVVFLIIVGLKLAKP